MAGIAATKFWIALNAILLSAGKLRQQVVSAVMQTPVPWGGAPHVEAYFKRTPHALAYTGVGSGMPGMRAAAFEYRTRCPALVRGESLIHSCRSIWLYIQTLSPNSTESRHHLIRHTPLFGLNLERPACGVRPAAGEPSLVSRSWNSSRNSSLRATSLWEKALYTVRV